MHKDSAMVSTHPVCKTCGKVASFGWNGTFLETCADHREVGMIRRGSRMCTFQKCDKLGAFLFDAIEGRLCSRHFKQLTGLDARAYKAASKGLEKCPSSGTTVPDITLAISGVPELGSSAKRVKTSRITEICDSGADTGSTSMQKPSASLGNREAGLDSLLPDSSHPFLTSEVTEASRRNDWQSFLETVLGPEAEVKDA